MIEILINKEITEPLYMQGPKCGRVHYDSTKAEKLRQELVEAFKGQPLNWFEAISKYQNNLAPSEDSPVVCFYGSDNDKMGNVIKFYESPGYGAGAHSVERHRRLHIEIYHNR